MLSSLALAPRLGRTLDRLVERAECQRIDLLVATETVNQVRSVVATKPVLRRRFTPGRIESFVARIGRIAERLPALGPAPPSRGRDPKDDDLLEHAIRFRTAILVTGDADLLAMEHPPAGLRIVEPRTFVDAFSRPD